jgi:hypothetical protein
VSAGGIDESQPYFSIRSITWFETIAGNQRTCSRACREVVGDHRRRADDALERVGVASGLVGGLARGVHDPLDDLRVGELDDHAVADAPGDRERLRAVARDPDLDVRQLGSHPLELQLLAVPLDGTAVHQVLDHRRARLELGDPHGLEADDAPRRVAAADAHHHAPVREVLHRRVPARGDRRVADAGVRDEVPSLIRSVRAATSGSVA